VVIAGIPWDTALKKSIREAHQPFDTGQSTLSNRIAAIAAHLVTSRTVLLLAPWNGAYRIAGSFGLDDDRRSNLFDHPIKLPAFASFKMFNRLRAEPWFAGHPIAAHIPMAGTAMGFAINHGEQKGALHLMLFDPEASLPRLRSTAAALTQLCALASEILAASEDNRAVADGFSEPNGTPMCADQASPVTDFLLATLQVKRRLLQRNGVSYFGLRTWSASIKTHQMRAIEAIKQSPPRAFIERAAEEITAEAKAITGTLGLTAVVPVPCGHSKIVKCFSVQLAEAVAKKLHVPFRPIFKETRLKGGSHPSQSAALLPMAVEAQLGGRVLLIDDIASSGRHIELAVNELRKSTEHVTAIAWIAK
jgi:predicted amidophosphoribosyltransferase